MEDSYAALRHFLKDTAEELAKTVGCEDLRVRAWLQQGR